MISTARRKKKKYQAVIHAHTQGLIGSGFVDMKKNIEYDELKVFSCLSSGPLVYFLQQIDRALSRASPFAAVGVVVGTVYWSAVTYGAVTVMQVLTANNT